jgi:thiol:disulfide interchange protein
VEWSSAQKPAKVDFYPYENALYEVGTNVEALPADPGKLKLRVPIHRLTNSWPGELSGLLVQKTTAGAIGYEVSLSPKDQNSSASASAGSAEGARGSLNLVTVLLYAFLGGLILNIMPCVLPVIALKILGFVGEARSHPAKVRTFGLIYGLGVLISFLVLAGFVIGLKAAGHKAGWGMQFSNPQFIVGLVVLVTLVALNLFGVFEVTAGGKLTDTAGELASRGGAAGAFFNGVLATILGTPCTAPFLSLALGFAFTQPAGLILLVFATVAVGMAFPYVLLSWNPAWLKFMPKPGAWMVRFKVAMGFPMLATAFWLFSLLPIHYGERSWWVGIFLVFVGLAAWCYGEFYQRSTTRRGIGLFVVLVLLAFGYLFALESNLHWRSPVLASDTGKSTGIHPAGLDWQPWSSEAVNKARAEQRPIIVDFTAQWCATCNLLVKPALESAAVVQKLKALNAVTLVGDYTRFPPAITEELGRYGRAGVPLVLVYPKNPSAPPIPLPEPSPISSYGPVVLKHLEEAEKM